MDNKHNITNPLILTFHKGKSQYVVNKPNVDGGEFVEKKIAEELLNALKSLYEFAELYGVGSYPKASHEDWSGHFEAAKEAINNATE